MVASIPQAGDGKTVRVTMSEAAFFSPFCTVHIFVHPFDPIYELFPLSMWKGTMEALSELSILCPLSSKMHFLA